MADLSIIEFGVYGFIAYSGLLMLIISTIRETPQTKSQSFARAMYLIPSIICAFLLASSGQIIGLYDVVVEVDDGSSGTHAGLTLNEHIRWNSNIANDEKMNRTQKNPIFVYNPVPKRIETYRMPEIPLLYISFKRYHFQFHQ